MQNRCVPCEGLRFVCGELQSVTRLVRPLM